MKSVAFIVIAFSCLAGCQTKALNSEISVESPESVAAFDKACTAAGGKFEKPIMKNSAASCAIPGVSAHLFIRPKSIVIQARRDEPEYVNSHTKFVRSCDRYNAKFTSTKQFGSYTGNGPISATAGPYFGLKIINNGKEKCDSAIWNATYQASRITEETPLAEVFVTLLRDVDGRVVESNWSRAFTFF